MAMVAFAATTALTSGHLPASADDAATAQSAGWHPVPGPVVAGANSLNAVAPLSGTDVWAVGSQGVVGTDEERPLTVHWDGRSWATVAAPGRVQLRGVSGTRSTDVWAVGARDDSSQSTVLHWDGVAWRQVPHVAATPEQPLALGSVAALAADDAWAVGFRGTLDGEAHAHTQHWDGTAWREVTVPEPTGAFVSVLSSVSGTSRTNVWAAGFGFGENGFIPYFVHWNGVEWRLVEPPATIVGGYTDIHAVGSGGFVAVGNDATPADPVPTPVAATFDGRLWQQETLPDINGELDAVAPDGSGGFWAAGTVLKGLEDHDGQPLILRRSSRGVWSVAAHPVADLGSVRDVQRVPGQARAWAVGRTGVTDETVRHLILRY